MSKRPSISTERFEALFHRGYRCLEEVGSNLAALYFVCRQYIELDLVVLRANFKLLVITCIIGQAEFRKSCARRSLLKLSLGSLQSELPTLLEFVYCRYFACATDLAVGF